MLDGDPSTEWGTSNIPAIIDVEFPLHHRVEAIRLVNGVTDGADQIAVSAYTEASGDWRAIQTFRFQLGEDKTITFADPVVSRRFRLQFPTFHIDGVAIRDIYFLGYTMDDAWMTSDG